METVETLGKYEIKRTLGRGAMGVVYEGWDPSIQRHVAIKTVPLTDVDDPETQDQIARFRREAQAAGRLTHENIVPVYDYGETSGVAYIVMEYVEGPTLDSLIKKQERFGLPEILRVMQDLLAGLEFSHERGVVHRDIKPANLMLTSNDRAKSRIKIADFGIARIESSSMTQAGTMMGTPTYMSPEQFMAETVDSRTDIYSSGVLLYQLLTGERPFEGGLSAIMHKALHTEPPAPSRLSVTSPPALDAVVKKAMAKRPDERFATAAAFSEALAAAASVPAVSPPPEDATIIEPRRSTSPPVVPPPIAAPVSVAVAARPKRGVMPIAAGFVVVLLAAGASLFLLLRRPAQVPQPTPSPVIATPTPTPAAPTPPPATTPTPAPETPAAVPPPAAAPAPVQPAVVAPAAKPAASPAMISDMFAQITATQNCALIGGSVEGNEAVLTGIAGPGVEADIRQAVASHAVPGTLQWKVANVAPVFCPALTLLQSVASPFGSAKPDLALTLLDNRTALHDGDYIRPRLVLPDFAGYLRVDYIAHDGTVQHLYPQVADSTGTVADKVHVLGPGEKVNLGDPAAGQPGWEVAPPFGTDMIIAVASSRPLFTKPRPGNVEPATTYLRDLDTAVQALRDGGGKLVGNALLVDALAK